MQTQDDDEQAFTLLYATHYTDVLRYAARRIGTQHAEDVAEETFIVAWRRRREVSPEHPLPWLYAVAGNVIANMTRLARRRGEVLHPLDDPAGLQPIESDHAEIVARRQAAVELFGDLSTRDRELVRLIAWEAAVALRCTSAAVHIRLHRLRKRLSRLSQAHGETQR
jgi:RNA polymerase sigma-70 factor (ECF subfamily)